MEKHYVHNTDGRTCTRTISFDYIDGHIHNVKFIGGCRGNTQGVAALAEGMTPQDIVEKLSGIHCRGVDSCPNELATAVSNMMAEIQ